MPEFAQKAVIFDGDNLLMVRKSGKDPYNPGSWELPGGRLKGAEDLDDQIRREVKEETGLTVEPGTLIDLWSWDMDRDGEATRVVAVSRYCHVLDTAGTEPRWEDDDFLDGHAWHRISDLLSLDIIPAQLPTIKFVVDHMRSGRSGAL